MTHFYLPDLGEGLQDARIVEWFVGVGDSIQEDDLLMCVETAKAIVEIPAPYTGTIKALFGTVGDTIPVGEKLVAFADVPQTAFNKNRSSDTTASPSTDSSPSETLQTETNQGPSVVGQLNTQSDLLEDHFVIGAIPAKPGAHSQSTPPETARHTGAPLKANTSAKPNPPDGYQPLDTLRLAMAENIHAASQQVSLVTLFDEANIQHWDASTDTSVTILTAMLRAIQVQPDLNAWYDHDSKSRRLHQAVHLGLAVDTPKGLLVPVIRNLDQLDQQNFREAINHAKSGANDLSLAPSDYQGATISLSNFGSLAGKHATPLVVPPQVCILGIGQRFTKVQMQAGKATETNWLPVSLSFDHRACTGGEAARFLAAFIKAC